MLPSAATVDIRLARPRDTAPGDSEVPGYCPPTRDVIPQVSASAVLPRGSIVGRFIIVDALGRGSMGVVYKAYDPVLAREVALKLLHAGALGQRGEARLIREARAMAKVSHPNVVSVHEAFVEHEQVVLALEYVPGQTLWDWLQSAERPCTQILTVFMQAGEGLVAAHRAGLVHRDFKPANVLVGSDDVGGRMGCVKVSDFGIATGLGEQRGTDSSGASEISGEHYSGVSGARDSLCLTHAHAILGTPWYMAPEQHAAEAVDARSDQYAFCVALWEALAGASPFQATTADELAVAKRGGPPAWPRIPSVPRAVGSVLGRGLAPSPEARFPSMQALLDALDNALGRRKQRWWVTMAAVPTMAMAGVAAFLVHADAGRLCSGAEAQLEGVWGEQQRAALARVFEGSELGYAARTWTVAQPMLDAYARQWITHFGDACEATSVRGEQSQAVMDLRMACLHRSKTELRSVVKVLEHGDALALERAVTLASSLPPLSRCDDVESLLLEIPPPADPNDAAAVDEARALLVEGESLRVAGRPDEALAQLDAAARVLDGIDYPPVAAELAYARGNVEADRGEYKTAETTLRDALRAALAAGATELSGTISSRLAHLLAWEASRPAEALWLTEVALGIAIERRDEAGQTDAHAAMGTALLVQGRYDEAEAAIRQSLAPWQRTELDHPKVILGREDLGHIFQESGRFEDAEAEHRAVLELRMQTVGPEHPDTAKSHANLGLSLASQGRFEESETSTRQALAILRAARGDDHPDTLEVINNLANVLLIQDHNAEAERELRAALAMTEGRDAGRAPPEPMLVARLRNSLVTALWNQQEYDGAEHELRQVLDVYETVRGPRHPNTAEILRSLGQVLHHQGQYEEAASVHERVISIQEEALGSHHATLLFSRLLFARALLGAGQTARARRELERAVGMPVTTDLARGDWAACAFELARILERSERPRALQLARQAQEILAALGERGKDDFERVTQWLEQAR